MKPRKLTKTMKAEMQRRKESLAIKREMKAAASKKVFVMTTSINAQLYDSKKYPSVSNGTNNTSKSSIMEERYKETPEVRAAIERKANCLAPAYNKGAYQYISDEQSAKDAGKKNVY